MFNALAVPASKPTTIKTDTNTLEAFMSFLLVVVKVKLPWRTHLGHLA